MQRIHWILLALVATLAASTVQSTEADSAIDPLHVGDAAPALTLNDQQGRAVSLKELRAKETWTVLAFYPRAGTPG
ncbi:MAG TPA: redoxin domain-containing protein [Planctomycetes bacterium]|nr:redoxin domain-containing protein [Planctomycetota bacterium]